MAFCTVLLVTPEDLWRSLSAAIWRLQEMPKMVPLASEGQYM